MIQSDLKFFKPVEGNNLDGGYMQTEILDTWNNKDKKQEARPYGKHEFCISVKCFYLYPHHIHQYECKRELYECGQTAKQFHEWLTDNGFMIVKAKDTKQ